QDAIRLAPEGLRAGDLAARRRWPWRAAGSPHWSIPIGGTALSSAAGGWRTTANPRRGPGAGGHERGWPWLTSPRHGALPAPPRAGGLGQVKYSSRSTRLGV